jgi:hypothetical protein
MPARTVQGKLAEFTSSSASASGMSSLVDGGVLGLQGFSTA